MNIYNSYIEKETCYEFINDNDKVIMPKTAVILIDDESGMIAVKGSTSRKTLLLVRKNENNQA